MRVARAARAPAVPEVDAHGLPDRGQPLLHERGALGAELVDVELLLGDAGGGRGRVEVVGVPGHGEGVGRGRVRGAVGGDAGFELPLADVAP